jgi:hypothetical protein
LTFFVDLEQSIYPNNLIIADFKEPKIQMNCGVFALFEAKEFKLIFELTAVEI